MRSVLFYLPVPVLGRGFIHLPVFAYGTMLMLGFLCCIWISSRRLLGARDARGRRLAVEEVFFAVGVIALVGGIAGARLLHVVQFWRESYADDPSRIWRLWEGGLVFQGGFLAAAVGLLWYSKKKSGNPWLLAETIAPVLPLGVAFTRLGCFLNGCCFGRTCEAAFALAVVFPDDAHVYHAVETPDASYAAPPPGTSVYPAQLFSSLGVLLLFVLLTLAYERLYRGRRRRPNGEIFLLLFVLYAVHRFIVEYWRVGHSQYFRVWGVSDALGALGWGFDAPSQAGALTIGQAISALLFAVCLPIYLQRVWSRRRAERRAAPAA